jgi:hypothetical protein
MRIGMAGGLVSGHFGDRDGEQQQAENDLYRRHPVLPRRMAQPVQHRAGSLIRLPER